MSAVSLPEWQQAKGGSYRSRLADVVYCGAAVAGRWRGSPKDRTPDTTSPAQQEALSDVQHVAAAGAAAGAATGRVAAVLAAPAASALRRAWLWVWPRIRIWHRVRCGIWRGIWRGVWRAGSIVSRPARCVAATTG